ncbi:hypothetical protein Tco_0041799 [Tanacetum coccineum]
MYDPLSLDVWPMTFPVGLQIQHAEDLIAFSPFPSATLTTAFGPAVEYVMGNASFSFGLGVAVLTGLTVLSDAAALGELCLAALTGTYPDFVVTAVGTKILLRCG